MFAKNEDPLHHCEVLENSYPEVINKIFDISRILPGSIFNKYPTSVHCKVNSRLSLTARQERNVTVLCIDRKLGDAWKSETIKTIDAVLIKLQDYEIKIRNSVLNKVSN